MPSSFIPVGAPIHRRRLSRLETALVARRNVLELIPLLSYRQPIVSGKMLMRWHMLADPAGMKRVMLDNLANYPKSEIMRRMLRPAIGDSLFNADGADWKWQRQAVAPVFTHRNVLALAPAMTATASRARARLERGGRIELVGEMLTSTFDVICDVALSGREHFDAHTFGKAISEYFRTAGRASLLDFLGAPEWFPRPGELLAGAWCRPCTKWLEQRSKPGGGRPMRRPTTFWRTCCKPRTQKAASAWVRRISFSICSFSSSPATKRRLLLWPGLSIFSPTPPMNRTMCGSKHDACLRPQREPKDLAEMPLVRQVLEESMRLYPPVGLLARTVVANDELCGRMMQPNDIVFLAVWALHRHELLWERPAEFRPARFAQSAGEPRDKYQYLPFGAGPRVCVGADFAMMQAQIILATLIQHFRVQPVLPTPRPVMMMTVRPEPGVFLDVAPVP